MNKVAINNGSYVFDGYMILLKFDTLENNNKDIC